MALVDALAFIQNVNDINAGVVNDTSNYGVGGNPARNATANYLLWSKTNKNSVRTFINPTITDVLNQLSYAVATTLDGWYEAILLRIGIYDNATSYVSQIQVGPVVTQYASVVEYNNSVYVCIQNTSGGHLPTDPAFWALVTDLSTLLPNTNVHVFIEDFKLDDRLKNCTAKKFSNGCGCGCGCDGDISKVAPALLLRCKMIAADAAFANDDPADMEKIIEEANSICSNC